MIFHALAMFATQIVPARWWWLSTLVFGLIGDDWALQAAAVLCFLGRDQLQADWDMERQHWDALSHKK